MEPLTHRPCCNKTTPRFTTCWTRPWPGPRWKSWNREVVPSLPQDALCGGRLVLWNLSGFDQEQRQAWAALLERREVGLVVAGAPLDQAAQDLALRVRSPGSDRAGARGGPCPGGAGHGR